MEEKKRRVEVMDEEMRRGKERKGDRQGKAR